MASVVHSTSVLEQLSVSGKRHVVVLYGGMSSEREVSLSSGLKVGEALVQNGYQVTAIDMGEDIGTVLQALQPDVVFNCLHGRYGEDGCIQGLLNIMKIPYTHSGVQACAMALDKNISKVVMTQAGIPMTRSILVSKGDPLPESGDPFPRPYVVKPLGQGSSIGIELVFADDPFQFKDYKFPYGEQVLVEQYVKGRELNVAVLDGVGLGVLEIKVVNGKRFYDYESKYTPGFTEHFMPAELSIDTTAEVIDISEKVYRSFNCRGLARVECILAEVTGQVFVLEINTHPGMTPLSICPEIALFNGITFNALVERMLSTAQCDS